MKLIVLLIILTISTLAFTQEKQQYLYKLTLTDRLFEEKNWTAEDENIITEHFLHLKELTEQKIVILAGKTMNTDSLAFGVVIFETSDSLNAVKIMNSDPAVVNGIMRAELFPYKVSLMRKED